MLRKKRVDLGACDSPARDLSRHDLVENFSGLLRDCQRRLSAVNVCLRPGAANDRRLRVLLLHLCRSLLRLLRLHLRLRHLRFIPRNACLCRAFQHNAMQKIRVDMLAAFQVLHRVGQLHAGFIFRRSFSPLCELFRVISHQIVVLRRVIFGAHSRGRHQNGGHRRDDRRVKEFLKAGRFIVVCHSN